MFQFSVHRLARWAVLLAAGAVLASLAAALAAAGPVVRIDSGELEGEHLDEGVDVFLGVPFAAAPARERRWRAPRPVPRWTGVRAATAYGPMCPQIVRDTFPEWLQQHFATVPQSEDCLNLNIWAPSERAVPLPVMVYIHGGNMQFGSGSYPVYDGRYLAREGIVLVTINYRVGFLGRFAHPALTAAQADEPLVNYGVMDQIAALQWVRRNIEAFGGDPDNVTIFGHSAGGVSVNFLMASPAAAGLFHRAIAQGSGVSLDANRHAFERGPTGPFGPSSEDVGRDFAAHFDIEGDGPTTAAALRALSVEQILDYQADAARRISFNPVVDGRLIPDHVVRVFERGEQHDVPYIGGANSWEWGQIEQDIPLIAQWFMAGAFLEGLSDADLAPFDDQWTRIGVSHRWFAEGIFLTSTRYLAKQMAQVSSPAWLFHVTYQQENIRGGVPGAWHGMEVPFIFGTVRDRPEFQRPKWKGGIELTPADLAWGDTLRAYWIDFARNGDPNGAGRPAWPEYRPDTDITMELGAEIRPRTGLHADTLDYLEQRALVRRAEFLSPQSSP